MTAAYSGKRPSWICLIWPPQLEPSLAPSRNWRFMVPCRTIWTIMVFFKIKPPDYNDYLLFSMDVGSLYTNIDKHSEPGLWMPTRRHFKNYLTYHWNTNYCIGVQMVPPVLLHSSWKTICPQLCHPFHCLMGKPCTKEIWTILLGKRVS